MRIVFTFYLFMFFITGYGNTIKVSSVEQLLNAKENLRGGGGSATVVLAEGIYFLKTPLSFDEEDGRDGENYITYKAEEGATPVLSGGYQVSGTWTQVIGKSYYKTTIPASDSDKLIYTRNLYVDGKRARRAKSGPVYIRGTYEKGFTINASEIPMFSKPQYVELNQLVRWRDHYYKLINMKAVTAQNGDDIYLLEIKNLNWARTMSAPMWPGGKHKELDVPFYFENGIELLDEPGEWYYDAETAELYYYPLPGQEMNNAEFILPCLDRVIEILSSGADSKVKNIRFEGLTFSHTNYAFASKEGFLTLQGSNSASGEGAIGADRSYDQPNPVVKTFIEGACQLDGAERIVFKNNMFTHLGGNGLNIHNNTSQVNVLNNTFQDISGTGIRVSSCFNMKIGDISDTEGAVSNTLIKNNFIHRIGCEFKGSIGIEFMYTDNIKVLHNEIRKVPYLGISCGYGWESSWSDYSTTMRDAEVRNNKITGALSQAKEGGSIYTLNRHNSTVDGDPGLLLKENYIDETSFPLCSLAQAPFHNDEGSHNVTIKKNVIKTARPNFQWSHKNCVIRIDSNYVEPGKTTNYIGKPRRCSLGMNELSNTMYLPDTNADVIIRKAGIQAGEEPPAYNKYTANLALNKPVYVSSTYLNRFNLASNYAVDGSKDNAWQSDRQQINYEWFYVDLGGKFKIREVWMNSRGDTDATRTRMNFIIEGADNPDFKQAVKLHEQDKVPYPHLDYMIASYNGEEEIQYIRVKKSMANEYLSIGEIMVFGVDTTAGVPPEDSAEPEFIGTQTTSLAMHSTEFSLQPNPVENTLTFKGDVNVSSIKIYNLLGVGPKIHVDHKSVNAIRLDVHDLNSGVYIIVIQDDNGKMHSAKFIKK